MASVKLMQQAMSDTIATFDLDGIRFPYRIIRKARNKHTYIRIARNEVIVTAPHYISTVALHQLLAKRASWIDKHLSKKQCHDLTAPGAKIFYLGKGYKIVTSYNPQTGNSALTLTDEEAHYQLRNKPDHQRLLRLRDAFYKVQAPTILEPMISELSNTMGLYPNAISFRCTKSRWGSCSPRDNISINTRALMLPTDSIRYLIVHELAHIRHKNHARSFWNLVAGHVPDWPLHRKKIRHFEQLF